MPSITHIPFGQHHNLIHSNWYEFPSTDPDELEVWCYTDQITYAPGEQVEFHASTTADTFNIEVIRDGAEPRSVHQAEGLPGRWHETPADCSLRGCGWPVAYRWVLPGDLDSGGYLVVSTARNAAGEEVTHHHFFVVRSADPGQTANMLLVCATSTWIAYNNWGGSNHYEGNWKGQDVNEMSPVLSLQRPWGRGQAWLPAGAPRLPLETRPVPGAAPIYPSMGWAISTGYPKYYVAAGWAMFERHFVVWAEENGYSLDYATQHDLQFRPELLRQYKCVLFVGHDEYWSGPMRDAVDDYVDGGGHVARFGANFLWQIRLEDEGNTQVCYKYNAREQDPLAREDPGQMTGAWEDPIVGRPGASTMGLNALRGVYAGWGGFSPRQAGGFVVYRPEHWVFDGSDLYFGDVLGSEAGVFGYEVDGVDFTFREGQPYPTGKDGAPETLEILAMAPSTNLEEDHGNPGTCLFGGDGELLFTSQILLGDTSEESQRRSRYGAGMMAVFTRSQGMVFNAGSCEWVNGLRLREPMTERVTKNVLDRLGS